MPEQIILTPESELRRIVAEELKRLSPSKVDSKSDAKEIFTTREAMQFIGVSRSTLQRWRADGVLPHRKINGSIRYTRADLENMLEAAAQ